MNKKNTDNFDEEIRKIAVRNNNTENDYEQIGRVTAIWNDAELLWYLIFVALADMPRDQANAIYHSIKVFAGQRDMVFDLGKVVLSKRPDLTKTLTDLYNFTGQCSGSRNAITHAKYIKSPMLLSLAVWEVGKNRLIGKNLTQEIQEFLVKLEQLTGDLLEFLFHVCWYLEKEPPSIET